MILNKFFFLAVGLVHATPYSDWTARRELAGDDTEWEYKDQVDDNSEDKFYHTLCSISNFEAFDLLPPAGARTHDGASGLDAFGPGLEMQLRTTSWATGAAFANLSWATSLTGQSYEATVKHWVNYFSFTARALPLLSGVTTGDVALPPLPTLDSFLLGFWYRAGPTGSGSVGDDALMYMYGKYENDYDLSQGFELTMSATAYRQYDTDNHLEMPARVMLKACKREGTDSKCKKMKWKVADLTATQRHSSWMHLVVGVHKHGAGILYMDGIELPHTCWVGIAGNNGQVCTLENNRACQTYACAGCHDGESSTHNNVPLCSKPCTTSAPCDEEEAHTVFGLNLYDRVMFKEPGFSNMEGTVFPATDAIRYLSAPNTASVSIQRPGADGWYADPVAQKINHDLDDLDAEVLTLRSGLGTYAFVNYTDSISTTQKKACTIEAIDLLAETDPVGLSCFPTAPLSCVAVPHASHVCATEASITFFEQACFESGWQADVPSCGDPCKYDFNNDGTVQDADADELLSTIDQAGAAVVLPWRVKDVNGDGMVNASDVTFARATITSLKNAETTTCNPHFKSMFFAPGESEGYLPSGHHADATATMASLAPKTQCVIGAIAFGPDDVNSAADTCGTSFVMTNTTTKLFDAVELAKNSFGSSPTACALPAPCTGVALAACQTKDKVTLSTDFELTSRRRRSLHAHPQTTRPVAKDEVDRGVRRSLLRRQMPAASPPPPASPPSPPPSFPVLPSLEEWMDILSAAFFGGKLPYGAATFVNGLMAVLTVTIFEPIDEVFDVFSPFIRSDSRFTQRLCAIYSEFQVCT